MKSKIVFLLVLLFSSSSFAYEWMLRKGYSSCIACHTSPTGGGIMTDYGKMVSSGISMNGVKEYVEPEWKTKIRLGGKVDHAAYLRLALLAGDRGDNIFPMQADYVLSYKHGNSTLIAQAGRAPGVYKRADAPQSEGEKYYFREFKVVHKISDNDYLTVGRQKQNLGILLEDHTAYNKSLNRFNVTDLATIVSYDRILDDYQYNISVFGPSYQEKVDNRESGASLSGRTLIGSSQLGIGALYGKSNSVKRMVYDVLFKYPFAKFLFMFDAMNTSRILESGKSISQSTHYMRLSYFPIDSVELGVVNEKATQETPYEIKADVYGVMANLIMTRNISLRVDVKGTQFAHESSFISMAQIFYNWW